MKRVGFALYWILVWIAISAAIIGVGALLGALIWVTVGSIAGLFVETERTTGKLFVDGASVGWRYARVWAGGIAFILCFVKGYHGFSVRSYLRNRFSVRRSD